MKRLTRSNDKLVAGVISGISNYVNPDLDPVFFRVAFAFITIFQPYMILIYLGMAIILPVEEVNYSK
ncbi:MAG: PspC domain-containing protein [Bacteroidia bacterium]|jgi:phage shock protein C